MRNITALENNKLDLLVSFSLFLTVNRALTSQRYLRELKKQASFDDTYEQHTQSLEKMRGVCEGETFRASCLRSDLP